MNGCGGNRCILAALTLALTLCTSAVWAQTASGTILGMVMDDTRALVPGVTVTITNLDKGG